MKLNTNRLQTAAALLFAGYDHQAVFERSGCSEEEVAVLQDLLDARLIIPQPQVAYLPSGQVDVVNEFASMIPVFKGQVHVAILSTTSGASVPKGQSAPDMIKEYAGLLLQLAKLYAATGQPLTSEPVDTTDTPTLQALLANGTGGQDGGT